VAVGCFVLLVWLFVFLSSDWQYIIGALGIIVSGLILYFVKERFFTQNLVEG
jgi:hypothetical protein